MLAIDVSMPNLKIARLVQFDRGRDIAIFRIFKMADAAILIFKISNF